MATPVILADNQVIFRTGMARVLGSGTRFQLVAQCSFSDELRSALEEHKGCVVVYPSAFEADLAGLSAAVRAANSRSVVVLDHDECPPSEAVMGMVHGMIPRSVSADEFTDCLCRVAAGKRSVRSPDQTPGLMYDYVGANLLERLTRKELQIIALVSEGWKNREIADRLGTKEQVVKNYLCNIYDKTGVSDRLELALYTVHHRILANAAQQMRVAMLAAVG